MRYFRSTFRYNITNATPKTHPTNKQVWQKGKRTISSMGSAILFDSVWMLDFSCRKKCNRTTQRNIFYLMEHTHVQCPLKSLLWHSLLYRWKSGSPCISRTLERYCKWKGSISPKPLSPLSSYVYDFCYCCSKMAFQSFPKSVEWLYSSSQSSSEVKRWFKSGGSPFNAHQPMVGAIAIAI